RHGALLLVHRAGPPAGLIFLLQPGLHVHPVGHHHQAHGPTTGRLSPPPPFRPARDRTGPMAAKRGRYRPGLHGAAPGMYEMLTGKRAFDGANTASVIAAIL